MAAELSTYLSTIDAVPGWFYPNDVALFVDLSAHQRDRGAPGDLLEIGVYLGKSAVLLGFLVGAGERLVVCDLFEGEAATSEAAYEKDRWYPDLARERFEQYYRRYHDRLPEVVAGPSTELDAVGPDGSFRFIHVDGGHSYGVVSHDLATAHRLLAPDGVLVIDDWRSVHTPGVVAATWEAIVAGGLVPFCFTEQKLYATWTVDQTPSAEDVEGWIAARPDLRAERYQVMGRDLVRVGWSPIAQPPKHFGWSARLARAAANARLRIPGAGRRRPGGRSDRR